MKKTIFLVSIICLAGCKKSTGTESSVVNNPDLVSIQGKWNLSGFYVSPGGGVDLNVS